MAIEHDGRTSLTGGLDRLGAVVTDAVRRFTDGTTPNGEPERPATTGIGRRPHSTGSGDTTREVAPEEFRTPEESIVDAIERGGGAVRQSEIVSAVDWSESTVSRKLSALEEREAVSRYQIGREKLVFLPGHEPSAVEPSLPQASAD